jgi:hypothetical protein
MKLYIYYSNHVDHSGGFERSKSMSKRTLLHFPQGSRTNFFDVLFWSENSLVETVKTT